MKKILFDGTNLDNWHTRNGSIPTWTIEDKAVTVTKDDIISNEEFGDAFIHVEFREPDMPEAEGQAKGNSGVFIHGCYEIQVLDSFGHEPPDQSDCSAVYNMYAPLVNACLPALEWQTYDIIFRAPVFNGDEMTEPARLTLLHNGRVVHNNIILYRATPGGLTDHPVARGQLMLQDHWNKVSFRNIWIEEL
ncbi:hypothetical protein FACS1894219_03490 [Clostridia bacterium]|nr:hypothetical protein FACS1894219_03490 [Clostridia bacterium]